MSRRGLASHSHLHASAFLTLAALLVLPVAAAAQPAKCAKQDWTAVEFSDGSKLEVQERRESTLRYEVVQASGGVQEVQVRDGFIVEWTRTGRKVSRYQWLDAPERFRPLKQGMTFSATARTDLPDGRPQLIETTVTVGEQTAFKVGACTYRVFEVVQTNVIDKGPVAQKIVRYFHERSGLPLKTVIFGVAGPLEREVFRTEATLVR